MNKIRFLALLLFASVTGQAQWQIGVSGGVTEYQGDLADRPFIIKNMRPAIGAHAKYELGQRVLLRGGFTYAQISGNDRFQRKDYLRDRNLNFSSFISELHLGAEIHTFRLDEKRWSPYFFGGLALFHFNPYVREVNRNRIFLQPLSTEGQGLPDYPEKAPYALTQLSLPFGGGLRFNISDRVILGGEVGFRKLFTDYLDDVSTNYAGADDLLEYRGPLAVELAYRTDEVPNGNPIYPSKGTQRGSPKQKDFFYVAALSVSIRLGSGNSVFGGDGSGSRRNLGCPKVPR